MEGTLERTHPSNYDSKAVRVFKVSKNPESFKEIADTLKKDKVYDLSLLERLFPSITHKAQVTKEVSMSDGILDCTIDLIDDQIAEQLDEEKYPLTHLGCIAIVIMPLGRNLRGNVKIFMRDTRLKPQFSTISAFECKMSDKLSAFCDFPNYAISTSNLKSGFKLSLSIVGEDIDFMDSVHPISVSIITMIRSIKDDIETKFLLKESGKRLYQPLLNSIEIPTFKNHVASSLYDHAKQVNDSPHFMPEVEKTLKILAERYGYGKKTADQILHHNFDGGKIPN